MPPRIRYAHASLFFHTDSPWVSEVTKPLKARCGSVGKKYECRNQVMVGWQTEGVHLSGHFNIQLNIFEHTLIYFDSEDKKKLWDKTRHYLT